jgi:hypothetical protein
MKRCPLTHREALESSLLTNRSSSVNRMWPGKEAELYLCFVRNEAARHEEVLASRSTAPPTLTSTPDGAELSTSFPDRFFPR